VFSLLKTIINRACIEEWWKDHLDKTAAATRQTSKPYRVSTEGFFGELHHVSEQALRRALTGYDARYECGSWRSRQLAEYLADWLPEVVLKASELVEVQHLNIRHKLRASVKQIKVNRDIDVTRIMAEVLLHAVLRHHLKTEPIACKLFFQSGGVLKTFGNAHILHGLRDELWLGRAIVLKASNYDAMLRSVMAELQGVLDPDFLKQERQVILTLREPQHLLLTTLEEALKPNTPVDDLLEVICVPILIAYDSEVLSHGFAEDYRTRLIEEVATRYEAIKPALPAALKLLKVHIFLIPLECASTLIHHFTEQIEGT
jgi:hypothetical protein